MSLNFSFDALVEMAKKQKASKPKHKKYLIVDRDTGEVIYERDTVPFDPPKYRSVTPSRKYRKNISRAEIGLIIQIVGLICMTIMMMLVIIGYFALSEIPEYYGIAMSVFAFLSVACIHIGHAISKE